MSASPTPAPAPGSDQPAQTESIASTNVTTGCVIVLMTAVQQIATTVAAAAVNGGPITIPIGCCRPFWNRWRYQSPFRVYYCPGGSKKSAFVHLANTALHQRRWLHFAERQSGTK